MPVHGDWLAMEESTVGQRTLGFPSRPFEPHLQISINPGSRRSPLLSGPSPLDRPTAPLPACFTCPVPLLTHPPLATGLKAWDQAPRERLVHMQEIALRPALPTRAIEHHHRGVQPHRNSTSTRIFRIFHPLQQESGAQSQR